MLRRTAAAGVAACTVLAVLAMASASSSASMSPLPRPQLRSIDVIGDSVTWQATIGRLDEFAAGAPADSDLYLEALVSQTFVGALAATQERARSGRPETLVIALGGNVTDRVLEERDRVALAGLLAAVHPTSCVVVVLPGYGPQAPDDVKDRIDRTRPVMEAEIAQRPGTVTVDWLETSAGREEVFHVDGLHLLPDAAAGYWASDEVARLWTSMLWSGVQRCGGRQVGDLDCFVDTTHRLFVRRPATGAELTGWSDQIADGRPRSQLSSALAGSVEWLGVEVDGLYAAALDRPADPGGRAHWVERLRLGAQVHAIGSQIYGSDEYYQRAGGTPDAFITDLYRRILGRAPDAGGLAHWRSELHRLGRGGVAGRFFTSIESRSDRVTGLYHRILGRAPDAAGLAHWSGTLIRSNDVRLAVHLASSAEYADRSRGGCSKAEPVLPDPVEVEPDDAEPDGPADGVTLEAELDDPPDDGPLATMGAVDPERSPDPDGPEPEPMIDATDTGA